MRIRRVAATLLLLIAAGMAGASDLAVPKQAIIGADKPIPLGELVTLSVSPPEKVPHLESTSYSWKVFDGMEEKHFAVDSDGRIFFGAGIKPKRLLAVVAITHLYVVKEGEQVRQVATRTVVLTAQVAIGEPGPGPGPPAPTPSPDLPDGRYGLAKTMYELAMRIPAGRDRAEGAKALAGSFKAIKAAIAAGTLSDPEKILVQTAERNNAALRDSGVSREAWEPAFKSLQEVIYRLYEQGELVSKDSFSDAWGEIAAGLEAVN